jgi:anti-sigma factor RsiW
MDCIQARTYLDCYVDGELDAVTSAALERHVEQCASCRRAADRLGDLRALIKEAAPYHVAPPALARALRDRIGAAEARRGFRNAFWWQWLRPAALVAVTALMTWIVAVQFNQPPANQHVVEDVVASHVRSTLSGRLADVLTSDRHTLKPWLSSKLDFSPPVVDLSDAGFPLSGARLDYVNRRAVAVLVYGRRKHVINVFVWPAGDAPAAAPSRTITRDGYQVLNWTDRGMQFWAISDLNSAELKAFAERFSAGK